MTKGHWEEAGVTEIHAAYRDGSLTAVKLVMYYLDRIARLDKDGPGIQSVLEVNPDALFQAEALDRAYRDRGLTGPLHGIPLLLKDNIDTGDRMPTSAGSLALKHSFALEDAALVARLRKAGAILLGKANMTEFANFMTEGMPAGYSSRGGQVQNPYKRGAHPGGSSTGSAAAAASGFCTAAVGTETSGSILSPASKQALVGIKPTVGLISRRGIIPITYSQDTAGPLARSVEDAAILLGVMAGEDERDPATLHVERPADYNSFLDRDGIKGVRLGIPRLSFCEGLTEEQLNLFEQAIEELRRQGAVIVDPADLPSAAEIGHSSVLMHEFKSALQSYLAGLGPGAPVRTLAEIIAFNQAHPDETLRYGQTLLEHAEERTSGTLTEPAYLADRARDLRLCREEGIDAVLKEHGLDAILFPGDEGEAVGARAGYPSITVPGGFTSEGLPYGITFTSTAFSEPILLKLAYAFEQATRHRKPPRLSR
ncbi:amidase family protein [Paenibacillus aurantius]|uniref:Amidase family protein n=1 Tax=Paenibacillus aurantius TaxID=2918900 RepID=A0AA96RGN7_9BACL|nr:amidase family protein [Paenibacillus aurantius]WNQ10244.1 amidase family protein [Paenibacillus aurantius]